MNIESERLVSRKITLDDTDNLLGIFSDPIAMKHYPSIKGRDETIDWINWILSSYEKNGYGLYAWELKETGEFVGQCGFILQEIDDVDEIEIGYLFLRKYWNNGYATEAAISSREYGFNQLKTKKLISLIAPTNVASRRVAEKNGMTIEKTIKYKNQEALVYSIVR